MSRYARQGLIDQATLAAASVLVVGVGALGCASLPYLVGAGIGRVGLVDPDRVELSNLHRQPLYTETDVGRLKVDVASERLRALNSQIYLEAYPTYFEPTHATAYDLILDGTDNQAARYAIDDTGKPWIYAALRQWMGQVALFYTSRYRQLFPEKNDQLGCLSVLGPLPGLLGAIQALEAIQFLAGVSNRIDKLLIINALCWRTQEVSLPSGQSVSPTPKSGNSGKD